MTMPFARPQALRRRPQGNIEHLAPVATTTVSIAAGKMRMTFDTPVTLHGIPTRIKANNQAITAATQVSSTVIDLTPPAPPAPGQTWVIPANLSELRTRFGGYVASATGTF